nr:glucose n-acetyltransferase 1 [Quercus suber]
MLKLHVDRSCKKVESSMLTKSCDNNRHSNNHSQHVQGSITLVIIFTTLLFLSGYAYQQRTINSLQAALRPRIPPPPRSLTSQHTQELSDVGASRLFNGKGKIAYTQQLRAEQQASASVNWNRLAHVQIARNHHDVCNAIMVLAELHRRKSPARRILLFPRAWAEDKQASRGDIADPFTDSSRRLMRMAARRYGVELRPVNPMISGQEGISADVYSLASAFDFTDLDRVLSVETPGILLDATPLDAVLAFTEPVPFAMLHDTTDGDGVHSEDLLLIRPDKELYQSLSQRLAILPGYNDTLLPTAFDEPLQLASSQSEESAALIRSVGALHDVEIDTSEKFNGTAFLSDVAYLRFSDPKLPGPEYEIPWSEKIKARPANKDADWTWTKLYGEFSSQRLEICGLDLETYRQHD